MNFQRDWDRPHHPVYPAGVNSLETRVRLIEQKLVYDDRMNERERQELHARIASLIADQDRRDEEQEAFVRQVQFKVISALIAALGTLGLIVFRLLFPNLG